MRAQNDIQHALLKRNRDTPDEDADGTESQTKKHKLILTTQRMQRAAILWRNLAQWPDIQISKNKFNGERHVRHDGS